MAVKEVRYSRTFLSKTTEVDVGYHKAEWAPAQGLSDEDQNIREQIKQRFEFGGDVKIFGFDGNILYSFRISGQPKREGDPLKSIPYQTEVYIRKAGSEDNLDDSSDLEKFLKENQFHKE